MLLLICQLKELIMFNRNQLKENEDSKNFVSSFYSEFSKAAKESPALYFFPITYSFNKLKSFFKKG